MADRPAGDGRPCRRGNSQGRGGLFAHAIIASARMIQSSIPWIGACAALLTSLSYIPQVRKAWPRGSTSDLSLKMLVVLTAGLTLWVGYGRQQRRCHVVRDRVVVQDSRHAIGRVI